MSVKPVSFRLSNETVKLISESTKLTPKEAVTTSFTEAEKLMIERGTMKKPSKIMKILSESYQKLGEKLGWIEKRYYSFFDD